MRMNCLQSRRGYGTRLRHGMATLLLALAAGQSQAVTLEAVTEDSSYSYLENGRVAGPATAVVTATLNRAGLSDYRLMLYPWARAYDIALAEPNVLIYPIIRTQEREASFKWIGEFEEIQTVLYKLRRRTDLHLHELADAKAYDTGVVRDDVRHQYLRDSGFTRLVMSATAMDNFRKLLAGQVDVIPLSPRDARRFCEQLHIPFEELDPVMTLEQITAHAYLAFSLTTPDEVVRRATEAFDQLKQDGELQKLMTPR
ncbi:transporter substrate-binding domain-containing protein [Pseudomonas sp. RIT-PI-S]|uniref:substrate-binding periplasmic protein n=1 Tax=Pseudomonas sp. RIT-PI-S TaxID=3035295 RepID=UPI0021DA4813|nr:transporter substrate-binding domain-containing protein [Pseudomonas sp. RIT-PI-S]